MQPPDCSLFSEDGHEIQLHKELLFQTKFLRIILDSAEHNCCEKLSISCDSLSSEVLDHLVKFFYCGEIVCSDKVKIDQIVTNLTTVFGFPKSMNFSAFDQNSQLQKNEAIVSNSYIDDSIVKTELEVLENETDFDEKGSIENFENSFQK